MSYLTLRRVALDLAHATLYAAAIVTCGQMAWIVASGLWSGKFQPSTSIFVAGLGILGALYASIQQGCKP